MIYQEESVHGKVFSRRSHSIKRFTAARRLLPVQPVPNGDVEHGGDQPAKIGAAGKRRHDVLEEERRQDPKGGQSSARNEESRSEGRRLDQREESTLRRQHKVVNLSTFIEEVDSSYRMDVDFKVDPGGIASFIKDFVILNSYSI